METGKAIREVRKKLNMSQTKLSELTGIPQTTISGWERGLEPNIKEIKIISNALGYSYKEFLEYMEKSDTA